MASKTWDYLGKVQALLAKADDAATTPEESATYRAKAEELMKLYRIAEEELLAEDATSAEPIAMDVDLCSANSPFVSEYWTMYWTAARHTGVRVAYYFRGGRLWASAVGYEGDLRYAGYLYSAARLVFSNHLEPEIDKTVGERENIWRLRSSGIERVRIAHLLWGAEEGSKPSAHAKVGRIYKEECAMRGLPVALDGKGIVLKDFRAAYAREFCYGFSRKLREAADATDQVGGGLVLHGRQERVDEAFYALHPDKRPTPASDVATTDRRPAQRERKISKAARRRTERTYYSKAAQLGGAAGSSAAEEIELDRASNARRLDDAGSRLPAGEISR